MASHEGPDSARRGDPRSQRAHPRSHPRRSSYLPPTGSIAQAPQPRASAPLSNGAVPRGGSRSSAIAVRALRAGAGAGRAAAASPHRNAAPPAAAPAQGAGSPAAAETRARLSSAATAPARCPLPAIISGERERSWGKGGGNTALFPPVVWKANCG